MTKQSSVPALAMLNSLCQPRPQVKERTYEGGCGKLRDNSVTCGPGNKLNLITKWTENV